MYTFRDDARKRLTVTLTGKVALGELARFVDRQRTQDTWHYGVLYDARAAMWDPSDGNLRDLASHVNALDPGARGPVAVVSTDASVRTVTETYAALVRPIGIEIAFFEDIAAADRWLNERAGPV